MAAAAAGHRAAALLAVVAAALLLLLLAGAARAAETGGRRRERPIEQVPLVVSVFCKDVHGVAPGETCESVARAAGLSFGTFMEMNPNVTCAALFPGQWLCVKGGLIG